MNKMPSQVIDIWPGLAPRETAASPGDHAVRHNVAFLDNVTSPQLSIYPLAGEPAKRPAVLVLPGGGYQCLAYAHEGVEIAHWLNSLGFVAAVLHYRVPGKREAALQDAQRAMSLLRGRADEFGIYPKRLGILGFSAGAHLAARISAGHDTRAYDPVDSDDSADSRPDFAVLIYPAYLIGPDSQPFAEVRPHAGMPPIFMTQTEDDYVLCAPAYAAALSEAGVPVTSIMYETGGHGYALHPKVATPPNRWPEEAAAWLKTIIGVE